MSGWRTAGLGGNRVGAGRGRGVVPRMGAGGGGGLGRERGRVGLIGRLLVLAGIG